jgi:hypothetical protein
MEAELSIRFVSETAGGVRLRIPLAQRVDRATFQIANPEHRRWPLRAPPGEDGWPPMSPKMRPPPLAMAGNAVFSQTQPVRNTLSQPPAQQVSDARSAQANAAIAARALLSKARALGIKVGTNGTDLVMLAPPRMPHASSRSHRHHRGRRRAARTRMQS